MSDLFDSAVSLGVRNDMQGQKRIGNILRSLGYEKKLVRHHKNVGKFWVKKEAKKIEGS
jgi:hypothetical protein